MAVEVLSTAAAQVVPGTMDGPAHDPWTVLVGYEGNAAAVAWQVQQLTAEVDGEHRAVACSGPAALPLWQALEDLPTWPESAVTLKLTVAPSRCGELCRWLATQAPGVAIQAHAGNGIVIAHLPAATGLEQAQAVVAQSRQWVGAGEAVVVMRCPTPWKQAVSVWGPPRGDIRLMRAVKDRLDPQRIFNPGRFVDGI